MKFLVTWTIDVLDADCARAAALKALATQRNPESIATVFTVAQAGGQTHEIDLEEEVDGATPCGRCKRVDVPLHTNGLCGECGKGPTTMLWYIEFCENSQGIWHREWAASEGEANTLHREKLAEFGECARTDEDNHDGSYGDLRLPTSVEVDLTARGALELANEYATEEDPV